MTDNAAAKLNAFETALGFYANPDNWKGSSIIGTDGGKVAREVLAAHMPAVAPGRIKCFAANPVSWRGQPVEISEDGSCFLTPEALGELRPHSVREWREEDEIAFDKGDEHDPANMSRKDLLSLLKGKGAGNITLMETEELRGLAARLLAGEPIAKKDEPAPADGEAANASESVPGETDEPAPADGGE